MPALFPSLSRPLVFAHRGASLHAPENTLEAFDLGLRQGASVLELDVHLTCDGEVVVMHDATVDRTTNGSGEVRGMTYAQVAALDAGYHFKDRRGRIFFRDRGLRVPTLKEVLQAFPRCGFNIEIKQREPTMIEHVLRLLDRLKPENVLLTAGDDEVMRSLEAASPAYALGMSHGMCRAFVIGAHRGRVPDGYRGRALQIPPRYGLLPIVTKRLVDAAHAAGIEVHVWTINDAAKARKLVGLGVDGIMSDDPGVLVDVIRR